MFAWGIRAKWMLAVVAMSLVLLALGCSADNPTPEAATGPTAAPAAALDAGAAAEPAGEQAETSELETAPALVQQPTPEVIYVEKLEASAESDRQAAAGVSSRDDAGGKTGGILVSGSGEASAAPDLAIAKLGVEASGDTVGEARETAAGAISAVLDSLKDEGVESRDIQTSRLSIYPNYTTRRVTRCPDSGDATSGMAVPEGGHTRGLEAVEDDCYTERESVISGYRVNHEISVKLRDLDTVGRRYRRGDRSRGRQHPVPKHQLFPGRLQGAGRQGPGRRYQGRQGKGGPRGERKRRLPG